MSPDHIIFGGVDISSGRKPVTFAALDEHVNVLALQNLTLAESIDCLKAYENILLAINPVTEKSAEFKRLIGQAGLKQASKGGPRRWVETDSQENYRMLCQHTLLSKRTLEGRIQRALILYDERLQIPDPMDFFEEITRHKLIQGILPLENSYSLRELDALMAAYIAWMYINEPRQVNVVGNRVMLVNELEVQN